MADGGRARPVARALVGLAIALVTAGCAPSADGPSAAGPSRTATAPGNTAPALTQAEARQALGGYLAASADGPGSYRATAFYLPRTARYPRFLVADATRAAGSGARPPATLVGGVRLPPGGPRLLLFEQADPEAQWLLAGALQQPPGAALPALAVGRDGHVPVLPVSAPGLLAPIASVSALQAAVVDDGPASAATRAVASGPLTTGLFAAARDHADGLRPPPGDTYQWTLDGSGLPLLALRTAGGGALVFYAMTLTETVAVPGVTGRDDPVRSGPQIRVPAILRPLLPHDELAPLVQLQSRQALTFAALDPPAGHGKVQVVAIGPIRTIASAA